MKITPISKFESVIDSAFDKAKAGAELLIENELSLIKCILIKHETAVLEVMKELHDRATAAEAKCVEWLKENGRGGWIDDLRNRAEAAESALAKIELLLRTLLDFHSDSKSHFTEGNRFDVAWIKRKEELEAEAIRALKEGKK